MRLPEECQVPGYRQGSGTRNGTRVITHNRRRHKRKEYRPPTGKIHHTRDNMKEEEESPTEMVTTARRRVTNGKKRRDHPQVWKREHQRREGRSPTSKWRKEHQRKHGEGKLKGRPPTDMRTKTYKQVFQSNPHVFYELLLLSRERRPGCVSRRVLDRGILTLLG